MKSTFVTVLIGAVLCAGLASAASVSGDAAAEKSDAREKRSVIVSAPVVAAPAVVAATVPVVHSHVVHHNPTTVVKTEQVRSGDHASYSYSTEVKTQPIVHQTHTAAVVAAPAAAVVSAVHHTVPTYGYGYGYNYAYPYSYYGAHSYLSPYSYVIGK